MRSEIRDEVLRGLLAINAMLRQELRDVRRAMEARRAEEKHNPNWRLQPRAPRGTSEGGQWTDGGGTKPSSAPQRRPGVGPKQAQPRTPLPERQAHPAPAVNDNLPRRTARFGPAAALATSDVYFEPSQTSMSESVCVRLSPSSILIPFRRATYLQHELMSWDAITHRLLLQNRSLPFRSQARLPIEWRGPSCAMNKYIPARWVWRRPAIQMRETRYALSFAPRLPIAPPNIAVPGLGEELGIIVFNDHEFDLVAAMRAAGRTPTQIQTALETIRRKAKMMLHQRSSGGSRGWRTTQDP